MRELIQSSTRGNYGQDVEDLHAFGGLVRALVTGLPKSSSCNFCSQVSMAAAGAWSTEGGNFLIFEEFAKRSGANVRLNTRVISIQNSTEIDEHGNPIGRYLVATDDDGDDQAFDAVILATPLVKLDSYKVSKLCGLSTRRIAFCRYRDTLPRRSRGIQRISCGPCYADCWCA